MKYCFDFSRFVKRDMKNYDCKTCKRPGNTGESWCGACKYGFCAADRIGCQLMGVDFGDVGYLTYSANAGIGQGDLSKIDIIGPDPAKYVKKYKMHERFEGMLEWKI